VPATLLVIPRNSMLIGLNAKVSQDPKAPLVFLTVHQILLSLLRHKRAGGLVDVVKDPLKRPGTDH
jgi:hypothetical protein